MERIVLCFGKFYGGEKNLRIRFQPTRNFKHAVGLGSALSATAVNQQNLSTQRSPQKGKLKNAKGPGATPTAGFVASTKEPLWRCMECCGACCKLAKGLLLPLLKRSSQTLIDVCFHSFYNVHLLCCLK
ncbi:hypothetical protein Peur_071065 [Populus x canadensis]